MKNIAILAATQLVSAHFVLEYPRWRADTVSGANQQYSQWSYPCANVPLGVGLRSEWPLRGGSIKLALQDGWSYVFVNLALGSPGIPALQGAQGVQGVRGEANFTYTLTPGLWNSTGTGSLCIPRLAMPPGIPVSEGMTASLQVVLVGRGGRAVYNCADITLRDRATPLNRSQCQSDVQYVVLQGLPGQIQSDLNDTETRDADDLNSNRSSISDGGDRDAGTAAGLRMIASAWAVGMTLAFMFAMSL